MKGAVILGIAGMIVKVLGAFFRIPLANIIGDTGMGYYQTAYPVYILLLTLSTSGIPTAIARLVSERTAEENHREAYRVFKTSLFLLLGMGLVFSTGLFFCAPVIVRVVSKLPNAVYAMQATAPALFFVPVMAAFRGYFQGLQNMTPTAASQIFEQMFRVVVGLSLAVLLLPAGLKYAAAGASFGATAGSVFGLAAILVIFFRHRAAMGAKAASAPSEREQDGGIREPAGAIIKKIIVIAVPITIGAAIMPIMNNIDLAIVMRRLAEAGYTSAEANDLYGQLSGFATPLINFPQVLTQSIAMSLVPTIAAVHQTGDIPFMKKNVELGLRTAMLIGLPCAAGLFALARPIMLLLYPTQRESAVNAADCLAILAVGVIFLSSVQTLTGILQGIGRQLIPVANLVVGAVFKVAITYWLTGIPSVNVKGAATGTVCAYLIASALNLAAVKKYTGVTFDKSLTYIKPMASASGMGVAVWIVYRVLSLICGNAVSTLISVVCGIIVYGALIFALKGITDEELKMIPGGDKVNAVLAKLKRK